MTTGMSGYAGYDDDSAESMPKWAAKAIAKNQSIPTRDASGKHIPLSTFGNVDDRCIVELKGRYYIKVAGDVAFFTRLATEKGFKF